MLYIAILCDVWRLAEYICCTHKKEMLYTGKRESLHR
nr:MAG TPA: hypothetical protein [Bacteriophage sp.]